MMKNFDKDGRSITQRIIEISDLISQNAMRLQDPYFVPHDEFVAEQHHLLEECKRITAELAAHKRNAAKDGGGVVAAS